PQLGGVPNLIGSGLPGPHTIADLFAAMELGPGLLGVRLALGTGGQGFDPASRDIDPSSSNQTYVKTAVGFSLTGDFRLDTGLNFILDTGRIVAGGSDQFAATQVRFGIDVRGYTPLAQDVDLGFLADIHLDNTSATNFGATAQDDVDSTAMNFGAVLGAGPVYNIGGVTTVAGYLVLGMLTGSADPDLDGDDDEESYFLGIVPGLQLAADIHLTDWLYFRSGMQYFFGALSEREATPDGDDISTLSFSNFGWRAGLGLNIGNFSLDGAFAHGFLTSGPDFVGGQAPGLFTMTSMSYRF
ncbi:MAG: hypothetical protein ACNA8W_12660, partial [Bradymonadaceae bacterium]